MKLASVFAAAALLVMPTAASRPLAAGTPAVQMGQGGGTTIAAELLKDWTGQKKTMMAIADAMPEDKFGFKATPPERSYGEQILHVAGANVGLMKLIDSKATAPTINQKATAKAEILKALSDSYDFGEAALKAQTEATIQEPVQNAPRFLGPSTRARLAYFAMIHAEDIYGQMAVYLRLNGIVPPASRGGGM